MGYYLLVKLIISICVVELAYDRTEAKSIILANYHNVLLFFPRELGGNDDLRVIFDVRNATIGTFKYMPVIVDVAYDSELNHAYCYLESAVTSYIMLLKWTGGRWCYQIMFDFPASQFSKYMYHSLILMDNFLYWTTDRFIMSGRIPGVEKRVLLQPSWNRLYSTTVDKLNQIIYVAAFDYTENALFKCNLKVFSCVKLITPEMTVNYITYNSFSQSLYVASMQSNAQGNYLYRYADDLNTLLPVTAVESEVSNVIFFDEELAVYTNQQSMTLVRNINRPNSSRQASAHLIDPYALQYVFTFNQVMNFDTYPYPYVFSDYHELLYKNSLYLFYFYVCGMDLVENDHIFLPQMDLNNQFMHLETCHNQYLRERDAYLIPSIIAAGVAFMLVVAALMIFFWRSKTCQPSRLKLKSRLLISNRKSDSNLNHMRVMSDSSRLDSISNDSISKKVDLSAPGEKMMMFYRGEITSAKSDIDPYLTNAQLDENAFKLDTTDQTASSNESYDNDPSNLDSLNLNRYMKNFKCAKKTETYSTGIYIMNKRADTYDHGEGKTSPRSSSSLSTAASSPKPFSPNSSSSSSGASSSSSESCYSNNSADRAYNQSPVSSTSSSLTTISSNNRVKFNDYKIHHVYDRDEIADENDHYYDCYSPSSKIIYNSEQAAPESRRTLGDDATAVASSSLNIDKKISKYFSKDYISTCNIALYGSPNLIHSLKSTKTTTEANHIDKI